MKTEVIMLPAFLVVGIQIEANVEAFESGAGKMAFASLLDRKHEIRFRKNDHIILMQTYPLGPENEIDIYVALS